MTELAQSRRTDAHESGADVDKRPQSQTGPSVVLLDGDADNTLPIARELSEDLDATIIGTGTSRLSRLLRSNYCDVQEVVPAPDEPTYGDAVLEVIDVHRPQMVLPVGYESTAAVHRIRSDIPESVATCLPPSDSFRVAVDKAASMRRAARLGIDVPADYTDVAAELDAEGRPNPADALPFPVFCKARNENGDVATARVDEPRHFWETYERIAADAPDGDVLVQEYVDGRDVTYGCGALLLDNEVEILYSHEELRSVPRHGGSGTHLRIARNRTLERKTTALLRDVGWHGVALAEFRRRPDGTFVLMEINPKFWASYALASGFGYRFASTAVASALDLDVARPVGTPQRHGEMVFPLRELRYVASNLRDESVRNCLELLSTDARWDVDRSDLGAWLTPPVGLLRRIPVFRGTARRPTRAAEANRGED